MVKYSEKLQNTVKSGKIQQKGAKYNKKWQNYSEKWQNTVKSGKIGLNAAVSKYSEKSQNTAKSGKIQ